ncbi:MAG: HD-GYP domain-containing protein [Defluviitaleaceae bacterium]|nr:HD-GYP domain-containing protein [Defluviitaleaceae bacterium]
MQKILMEVEKMDLTQNINFYAPANIFNGKGVLLIQKDALIDNKGVERLKSHGVKFVETIVVPKDVEVAMPMPFGIVNAENFEVFTNNYKVQQDTAKVHLEALTNNESVDIDEIYDITESLVNGVQDKKDVFTYMWFLQDFDDHTFVHSNNVSILANTFGRWLKLSEDELKMLTVAGLLHDLGKLDIPKHILNKPGKLDEQEFEIIKSHPMLGYEKVKDQDLPEEVKKAILMHHERIDGSGYPNGLSGDEIHKFAKIIAICDIYDAMCSKRPHRDKRCPFTVISRFEKDMIGFLDTEMLFVFLENIAQNYIGAWAKLTNGRNAEIMLINPNSISKPYVRYENGEVISLDESDIGIAHLI